MSEPIKSCFKFIQEKIHSREAKTLAAMRAIQEWGMDIMPFPHPEFVRRPPLLGEQFFESWSVFRTTFNNLSPSSILGSIEPFFAVSTA